MRQLAYAMFITNNHNEFHLWWKENLVKHQKVSKYYDQDCSKTFILWNNPNNDIVHILFCVFFILRNISRAILCVFIMIIISFFFFFIITWVISILWIFVYFSFVFFTIFSSRFDCCNITILYIKNIIFSYSYFNALCKCSSKK